MILYILKYNIHPDKGEAYAAWAQTTIPRLLASPGLVELRGYRPATGSSHVAVTFEFADLAAWAAWMADEAIKEIFVEARAYQVNQQIELWGPSPVLPEPLQPES